MEQQVALPALDQDLWAGLTGLEARYGAPAHCSGVSSSALLKLEYKGCNKRFLLTAGYAAVIVYQYRYQFLPT